MSIDPDVSTTNVRLAGGRSSSASGRVDSPMRTSWVPSPARGDSWVSTLTPTSAPPAGGGVGAIDRVDPLLDPDRRRLREVALVEQRAPDGEGPGVDVEGERRFTVVGDGRPDRVAAVDEHVVVERSGPLGRHRLDGAVAGLGRRRHHVGGAGGGAHLDLRLGVVVVVVARVDVEAGVLGHRRLDRWRGRRIRGRRRVVGATGDRTHHDRQEEGDGSPSHGRSDGRRPPPGSRSRESEEKTVIACLESCTQPISTGRSDRGPHRHRHRSLPRPRPRPHPPARRGRVGPSSATAATPPPSPTRSPASDRAPSPSPATSPTPTTAASSSPPPAGSGTADRPARQQRRRARAVAAARARPTTRSPRWRELFDVNVVAPLALIQLALPALTGGTIVDITSDASVEAYEGWGGYGATKAALDQLGRVLAVERPDVRVLTVDPGDMRTRMHQDAFPGEDISDRPPPEASCRASRADRGRHAERPPSRLADVGAEVVR